MAMMLPELRFVLINTSHPGNIGAAARAMKNMGLDKLVLVDPLEYPSAQATARASGADDVLNSAAVYPSLSQALADCDLIFGTSARLRRLSWPCVTPHEFVELVSGQAKTSKIAVVFGREHSGLTNEELDHCHYLLTIPSNPHYSSLNIAAAVQIIAYEIYSYVHTVQDANLNVTQQQVSEDNEPFASAQDMERFYEHLHQTLFDIGFLQTEHPRKMMRRLRRLFNRVRPDRVELNILRGILTTIQRRRNV